MPRHPFVALLDAEPWIVVAFFGFGFLMFALGMSRRTEDAPKPKTAVIVDDDPDIRRGLRALIESRTPFAVSGEAHDGASGLAVIDALRPDVVIVDVKLAGIDGIELTRRVKQLDPQIPVIAFSAPEDDATGTIMRRAGASAHLVKGDQPDQIIATLLDFA